MMFLSPLNLMKIQFIMTDNNNRSQTPHYLELTWSSSQRRVSISGWRRPSCTCCLCNDSQLKSLLEVLSLKPLFPPGHGGTVEVFVGGEVDPLQTRRRSRDIVVAAAARGLGSGQAGLNIKLTENLRGSPQPTWCLAMASLRVSEFGLCSRAGEVGREVGGGWVGAGADLRGSLEALETFRELRWSTAATSWTDIFRYFQFALALPSFINHF